MIVAKNAATPRRPAPALSMNIEEHAGRFEALIRPWRGDWRQVRLEFSRDDLDEANGRLQVALEDVANRVDSLNLRSSLRDELGPLADLARRGQSTFKLLFPEGLRRKILDNLYWGATIEIVSDQFLLPWELLYCHDRPRYHVSGFWGMRYNIARMSVNRSWESAGWSSPGEHRPTINTPRPRVGLIRSEDLPYVDAIEVPAFRELEEKELISLMFLPPLDNLDRRGSMVRFRDFVGEDLDLLHLACHAEDNRKKLEFSLKVSNAFPITLDDFVNDDCGVRSGAFVVLNACHTGTPSPRSVFNWARRFKDTGARGLLATEFRVPDDFAARFASRFYDHVLQGATVGEALLWARRECWRTLRNPLGLGYSLYSSPDIQIVTESLQQ